MNKALAAALAAVVVCLLPASGAPLRAAGAGVGTLSLSGAWALYPMALKWVEEFQKINPKVRIDVQAGGAGKVLAVACDITTPEGRAAVFGAAGGPGKDFDIVVTNAGGPPPGDFREWERDAWIKAIDANMLTPIELIKATLDLSLPRSLGRADREALDAEFDFPASSVSIPIC